VYNRRVNSDRRPLYVQWITHLSIIGLAAVAFGQQPAQPQQAESTQTASENERSHPHRVQLSSKEMKKLVVKKVKPVYPEMAHKAGLMGKCGVRVVITPQAEIAEVRLNYGHPMIAPAALDAVRKWKFRPYLLDGHPVEAEGEVEINVP